MANLAIIS